LELSRDVDENEKGMATSVRDIVPRFSSRYAHEVKCQKEFGKIAIPSKKPREGAESGSHANGGASIESGNGENQIEVVKLGERWATTSNRISNEAEEKVPRGPSKKSST